ncbi:MAG: hypothetical protein GYB41_13750, partial [Oceanospirillales bacterium]|nr:hypothetical protein [Oceanospirillales bacterium]
MRPMLRWGLGTLLALLLSVLLLLSAVLFLPSGTRFALNFTASLLPQLELDGVDGTLASDLRIERLRFQQDELSIELAQLRLHWNLWALTEPRLAIHQLRAARLDLQLPTGTDTPEPEAESAPLQLPELPSIELPLPLELSQVALGHIRVAQGEQTLVDELKVSLAVRSQEQLLLIEPLQVEQPGSQVSLSGWVEPARQFLTHLELQGQTDLTRWVRLEHWPESLPLSADLVLDFDGAERIVTLALDAEQGDMRIRLQSQIEGEAGVMIRYQLAAEGLNPALGAPDWPGTLALDAHGEVALGGELPQLSLTLSQLQGQLRQQAISGNAQLAGDTRSWQIDALNLRYAGAKVEAKGVVSEQLALEWALAAPNLTRLLPDARGALELKGQLSGPMQQPAIQARIRASQLGYADQGSLERLSGDVALDLSGDSDWSVDLQLDNATAAGQTLDQVRLALNGTPAQHR